MPSLGKERQLKALEFEFDPNYTHANTRVQRLTTVLRVPMFDGFQMPTYEQDSETAAMYKQLLLRPSAIAYHDGLEDERAEQEAFSHLCSPLPDESSEHFSPSTAFSVNWMRHLREMEVDAAEGERRFLDRLEYPFSLGDRRDQRIAPRRLAGARPRWRSRPGSLP